MWSLPPTQLYPQSFLDHSPFISNSVSLISRTKLVPSLPRNGFNWTKEFDLCWSRLSLCSPELSVVTSVSGSVVFSVQAQARACLWPALWCLHQAPLGPASCSVHSPGLTQLRKGPGHWADCALDTGQARGLVKLSSDVWCDHVMMPGAWGRCAAHLRGCGWL